MTTSTEIKNDNISVTVSKKPGCQIKFEIFVTPKATQAAYAKALKMVNKEVSIPGFRKGKAPDAVVLQNFGKYVDQEWQELLLRTSFQEALDLVKIYPFSEESVKRPQIKNVSKENGANLSIEFESSPEVPNIDPSEIEIKSIEKAPVKQKQIDQTLEEIMFHHAQWEDITDRGVKEGDFIDLDIEAVETPPRNICTNTRFEVAKGKMGDWMRKLVIGKSISDTVEGLSEKEDCNEEHEHGDHCGHAEFKPTQCKITIKSIKKAVLPALDNELAKKTGVETIEQLKERVEADLNRQADEVAHMKMRKQLEDILGEKYPFDIPASVVAGEKKLRLEAKIKQLKQNNESEQEIAAKRAAIEEEISQEIDKAFRLFFISRKIAQDHQIQVTQEEILQELMKNMYGRGTGESLIDPSMDPSEVRSRLYVNVLSRKTAEYLVNKAKKG